MASVHEFTVDLNFKSQDLNQGIQKAVNNLRNFSATAIKIGAGIATAFSSSKLFSALYDMNTHLSNQVQLMDYDVEKVNILGRLMERVGGSTEGAVASLDSLSRELEKTRYGTSALTEAAAKYGIQYMDANGKMMDAEKLLDSLAVQMQSYDRATRLAIGSQLGLDSALLRLWDQGLPALRQGIEAQRKLGVVTKEDLRISTEFESAWKDLRDAFMITGQTILRNVLPPVTSVLKYAVDNLPKIRLGLALVAGAIGVLTIATKGFGFALKNALGPLGLLLAAVELIPAFISEWNAYKQGGNSIFELMGNALSSVSDKLSSFFSSLWDSIKNGWNAFVNWLSGFKDTIVEAFSWVGEKLTSIFTTLKDSISDAFKVPVDFFKIQLANIKEVISNMLPPFIRRYLDKGASVPVVAGAAAVTDNNYNINQVNNNNIHTNNSKWISDTIKGDSALESVKSHVFTLSSSH